MTDQRDEFYQPWLREPPTPAAAPKRSYAPPPAEGGIARDDPVPLGVDLGNYVLDEAPPRPMTQRVRPAAHAASRGATRILAWSHRAALAFANWTIGLGARADVPSRVASLEIPRRSAVVARRAGALIAAGGRALAATSGEAGRKTASAAAHWGGQARAALGQIAGRAAHAGREQWTALRPAQRPDPPPPTSGLAQLLGDDLAQAEAKPADTGGMPLFNQPPASPLVRAAAAAQPSGDGAPGETPPWLESSADERAPRPSIGGGSARGGAFPSTLPRWVPWGGAMLILLLVTFWLGSRWGGGAMDRAAVEAVVRETILSNPEIVPEALERHRTNQIASAIESVRPVLEKPFSGAWAGNANGDVTVTLFTDYGCVFCRASIADVDRLLREDKGVKLVYRELPIIAPQSKDAALAALAAARQGKYAAFHHAMFAAPGLDRAAIDAASTRAGVILDGRSDAGVDTRLFEREIDNNLALAQQLGLNATPTWIIGSRMLQGAVGYDALRTAVAAARAAN